MVTGRILEAAAVAARTDTIIDLAELPVMDPGPFQQARPGRGSHHRLQQRQGHRHRADIHPSSITKNAQQRRFSVDWEDR